MASSALLSFALIASVARFAAAVPLEERGLCPDGVTKVRNLQCCKWVGIRDALISDVFEGVCGEAAHSTVRIAFHDAIGFSTTQSFGGGADGSMIQFGDTELLYAANAGIDDIVGDLQPFADAHGISYGDVIQFGSSVALSLCPGAPVVKTYVGRKNATAAAPDGTVPDPFNPVGQILARMKDAGFSPAEVYLEVLLKGSHVPGAVGPGQGEVVSPFEGEFRLQSDAAFARDSRTACTWQSFVNNQALMATRFKNAMAKLGLLGQDVTTLADCTEVIPAAPPATGNTAIIPAGKTSADIEAACVATAFPALPTATGDPLTRVPPVPPQ
ncbi:Ligninase H2 [Exidia glandulosa HHB12029]|uniref:Ligninase H2 n=1 Tax=Exidia glandulosa HHB12029 TaxID=1314781 RepID=A0A165EM42_EXIGL|nr:Ligninase H2 [Exidia glandulosa HHB12029]